MIWAWGARESPPDHDNNTDTPRVCDFLAQDTVYVGHSYGTPSVQEVEDDFWIQFNGTEQTYQS